MVAPRVPLAVRSCCDQAFFQVVSVVVGSAGLAFLVFAGGPPGLGA